MYKSKKEIMEEYLGLLQKKLTEIPNNPLEEAKEGTDEGWKFLITYVSRENAYLLMNQHDKDRLVMYSTLAEAKNAIVDPKVFGFDGQPFIVFFPRDMSGWMITALLNGSLTANRTSVEVNSSYIVGIEFLQVNLKEARSYAVEEESPSSRTFKLVFWTGGEEKGFELSILIGALDESYAKEIGTDFEKDIENFGSYGALEFFRLEDDKGNTLWSKPVETSESENVEEDDSPQTWKLVFNAHLYGDEYEMFRLFETESESQAVEEGKGMQLESAAVSVDSRVLTFIRVEDAQGNVVWTKPEKKSSIKEQGEPL